MRLPRVTSGIQLALRAAAAAGISLEIAQFFRFDYPIYALIAAVIVTDVSHAKTTQLGLQRIINTVVGAICGAALSQILPPGAGATGLGICITMLLCGLLKLEKSAKVAGYVCGIVVLAHRDNPWTYASLRFLETTLGIGVAWLISFVPKLLETREPGKTSG
jgi:uncharacterized membrane protein YgaE (UPF0421/DUF939 family)